MPRVEAEWRAIYSDLRDQIRGGTLAKGHELPTQEALARRYGTSRHNVRRALAALMDEDLVHAWQGRGTYVARDRLTVPVDRDTRFTESVTRSGRSLEMRLLSAKSRHPTGIVGELLGVHPRQKVIVAEMLGVIDGAPFYISRHHYDPRRFPTIIDDIERHGGIGPALAALGVKTLVWGKTTVEMRPTTATESLALGLAANQPALLTTRQNLDGDGRPVEVVQGIARGDAVRLTM